MAGAARFDQRLYLLVGAALIFACYTAIATGFSAGLWPTTSGGFIFNSQLRSLLAFHLDIDPGVIGEEAFVRDGRTFTYFGILPALLRLPLVGQLWRDWTTLSCALAATLASVSVLCAFGTAVPLRSLRQAVLLLPLMASLVFSGPQVELLGKPSVYVEAVLWAYAGASLFLCTAMPVLLTGAASQRRLTALAACAAVALLARVSTGLSLYIAFAALVLALDSPLSLRGRLRKLVAPALVLTAAMAVTGTVNTLRWGHPLEFAPLTLNRFYAADPSRLARLDEQGVFALERVPYAMMYYAAPGHFFQSLASAGPPPRAAALFDGPEGPPVGIIRAQSLWLGLAAIGLSGLLAGAATAWNRRCVLAVAVGLLAGPLVVASYHYLAFRYRAEFAPLLLLFAALGARSLQDFVLIHGRPLRRAVFAALLVGGAFQVSQAAQATREHRCTPFGSYAAGRERALACMASPSAALLSTTRTQTPRAEEGLDSTAGMEKKP